MEPESMKEMMQGRGDAQKDEDSFFLPEIYG